MAYVTGVMTDSIAIEMQMKKKCSEETQTLHAGCNKAEPKKFHPAADLLPRGAGRPKFNQL